MEPFVFHPQYSIVICAKCQFAVVGSEVATHLRSHHPSIPTTQRLGITETIRSTAGVIQTQAELATFRYPEPTTEPIPHIAAPQPDGIRCRACPYVCRRPQVIQRHCRAEHGWVNEWQKGGNVRRKAKVVREVPWTTGVPCQRFFPSRAGSRWFEVGRGQTTSVNRSGATEEAADDSTNFIRMHEEQEKKFEASTRDEVVGLDEKAEPNPWLYRVGWAKDLQGLSKTKLEGTTRPIEPDEETLRAMWAVFESVADQAQAISAPHHVGHDALFEAERREVGKKPARPFDNRMEADTWQRYKEVWRKMICMWYRTEEWPDTERPPYRYTIRQGLLWEAWIRAVGGASEESEEEEEREEGSSQGVQPRPAEEQERACLDAIVAFIEDPYKQGPQESVIISALAVLGIREDGGRNQGGQDVGRVPGVVGAAGRGGGDEHENAAGRRVRRGAERVPAGAQQGAAVHDADARARGRRAEGDELDIRGAGVRDAHPVQHGGSGASGLERRPVVIPAGAGAGVRVGRDVPRVGAGGTGVVGPVDGGGRRRRGGAVGVGGGIAGNRVVRHTRRPQPGPAGVFVFAGRPQRGVGRQGQAVDRAADRGVGGEAAGVVGRGGGGGPCQGDVGRPAAAAPVPREGGARVRAGVRGVPGAVVDVDAHGGRAAGAGAGVGGDPARQHGQRRGAERVRARGDDVFCDVVPQELPADRERQGDPPVHAAGGWGVVGVVFVVRVAVLAAEDVVVTREAETAGSGSRGQDGQEEGIQGSDSDSDSDSSDGNSSDGSSSSSSSQEGAEPNPPVWKEERTWTSDKARRIMQQHSERLLGSKMNISGWRHMAIAVSNRYLNGAFGRTEGKGGEDDDEEEEVGVEDSAADLQCGHGTRMAGMIYARLYREAPFGTAAMRERFRAPGGAGDRDRGRQEFVVHVASVLRAGWGDDRGDAVGGVARRHGRAVPEGRDPVDDMEGRAGGRVGDGGVRDAGVGRHGGVPGFRRAVAGAAAGGPGRVGRVPRGVGRVKGVPADVAGVRTDGAGVRGAVGVFDSDVAAQRREGVFRRGRDTGGAGSDVPGGDNAEEHRVPGGGRGGGGGQGQGPGGAEKAGVGGGGVERGGGGVLPGGAAVVGGRRGRQGSGVRGDGRRGRADGGRVGLPGVPQQDRHDRGQGGAVGGVEEGRGQRRGRHRGNERVRVRDRRARRTVRGARRHAAAVTRFRAGERTGRAGRREERVGGGVQPGVDGGEAGSGEARGPGGEAAAGGINEDVRQRRGVSAGGVGRGDGRADGPFRVRGGRRGMRRVPAEGRAGRGRGGGRGRGRQQGSIRAQPAGAAVRAVGGQAGA
ncbi:hypothetical protein CSUB01_11679 [Colletotrichum sublineola]|uniref:Uncharacterized protein n=1 Tax=Colletotrichum sublineola TaxID=1173701 RepID=A0A066XMH5_COLSU|nr:hypothetical protein CSUB01_11679 [Colletotrichum sublineola]